VDSGLKRRLSYVDDDDFSSSRSTGNGTSGDRNDLTAYVNLAGDLGAERVLDIGCGTGCLAVRLAASGRTVVGVDPAQASLEIAKSKDKAAAITWIHGDATRAPAFDADLAVMTGNVAQVFITDADWTQTLQAIRAALRPRGYLEVTRVSLPLVAFRYTYTFLADGAVLTSDSTLRFRNRDEVESNLAAHGYRVLDVREAPDRPGRGFVFIADRTT
jgi:SAM-dependent methyltransferase